MRKKLRETVHVGDVAPARIKREVETAAPEVEAVKPEEPKAVEAKEPVKVRKKAKRDDSEGEALLEEAKKETKAPADKPKKRTRRK